MIRNSGYKKYISGEKDSQTFLKLFAQKKKYQRSSSRQASEMFSNAE